MEIFDFLHLTARRLIAVVVVALLAGAATAAILVRDSSDSYGAEAVVFLGQVLPADRSTFAIAPFAGDLEVLLSLDPTRDDVAAASGVDRIVPTDLTTSQISNGTAVRIRAVAPAAEVAETIASEAARVGLSTLLQQEQNRAQRNLDAVNLQLLQVRADLEKFRGDNATQDPVFEIRSATDERTTLQIKLSDATLAAAARETLEAREQALNDEIIRLVPLQSPYNELDRALSGVEGAITAAKQDVAAADALLAGSVSGDFVVTTPAEVISTQSTMRAGVVASMIVVVLLSIGFFVTIDRRRSRSQHEELGDTHRRDPDADPPVSASEHTAGDAGDSGTAAHASTVHGSNGTGAVAVITTKHAARKSPDFVCVCGRVCRTASGLGSHQRACETYQQSQEDDPSEDEPSEDEPSVHDHSVHDHSENDPNENDAGIPEGAVGDGAATPVSAFEARNGVPLRVLISELGTSDHWQPNSHRLLKQALEAAGLDEGEAFTIVNAHGDGFTQIRQAEQAIADGVSVILLIGSDPETSATIVTMGENAGVEIVEQGAFATRLNALGIADMNNGEPACTSDANDEQPPAEAGAGAGRAMWATPRWAPADHGHR